MTINVTQEDIYAGANSKCSSRWCPISRAISRSLGDKEVFVGTDDFDYYEDDGGKITISLPPAARTFINLFDGGEGVKPISFEVDDAS